jgi:toxin ParE1/3/4
VIRHQVVLTEDAERDLEDIHSYVAEFDSPNKADDLLSKLVEVAEKLELFPEEGLPPKELRALGIQEYRQVFLKPYRVIYRVVDHRVIANLIADGRRDMQTLLTRRLLNG